MPEDSRFKARFSDSESSVPYAAGNRKDRKKQGK